MSGVSWYRYEPSRVAAATIGLSNEQRLAFFDSLQRGLLLGTRGENPVADKMIQEREICLAKSADGGRKGAPVRWPEKRGANRGCTGGVQGVNTPPTPLHDTDKTPTRTETETRPDEDTDTTPPDGETEVGSGRPPLREEVCETPGAETTPLATPLPPGVLEFARSENKARLLLSLPAERVLECMLWYCDESNVRAARSGLKRQLKRLGTKTFRDVCFNFVRGLDSGNDPEPSKRGAALMARMKEASQGSS